MLDKKKLYIEILMELCNRTREEAEEAIEKTLERRRQRREQEALA